MARAPAGPAAGEAPKPGPRRPRAPRAQAQPSAATLRLYCHGLGDCMLLSLPRAGGRPFRILIDCGVHSATAAGAARIAAVVDDVAEATERAIDVVVGTHEHWDHLSGFLTASDRFVDAATPGLAEDDPRIRVGEVWLAWTENPEDPDAQALDRYKDASEATVLALRLALADTAGMDDVARGIDSLLGFQFGAKGERVRTAREALRTLAPVRYLEPGTLAPLPADLAGVCAYVLGPPRDRALLHLHDDPSDGYKLAFGNHPESLALASGLAVAEGRLELRDDPAAPFDPAEGVPLRPILDGQGWGAASPALQRLLWHHYLSPPVDPGPKPDGAAQRHAEDAAARRIDGAWLGSGAELALQLDRNTNNTSLVLAFEVASLDGVLLFAADAQAGNWRSWEQVRFAGSAPGDPVRPASDLVERTIFYKVGHHGSGNATLRARGLERMHAARLVAFNPTDGALAGRLGWKDFPAERLEEALLARTAGRTIRSDAGWIGKAGAAPVPISGALRALRHGAIPVPGAAAPVGWVEVDLG